MIPVVEKRTFETFGTNELKETSFKVKQSREMFKLLSSNIYSDKISAVIRELSANAIDAHTSAGNTNTPIEVHLPNQIEPFFYVKDFGTGLSKEDILHLYTTYGESTKAQDNSVTGCFGIGSKSPFAYTDQFTITSRFNGMKYIYNCYVGETGVPTVAPVAASETAEPNGLTIYFAVNPNDFRAFEWKAREIYKFYEVQPTIVGVAHFDASFPKTLMEVTTESGIKACLLEDPLPYPTVVQGACAYPVKATNLSYGLANLYSNILLVRFPLGSLNITASREGLEYDNHTCAALEKTAEELIELFAKEIQKKFKGINNEWDAVKLTNYLYTNLTCYQGITDKVVWRDNPISSLYNKRFFLNFKKSVTETQKDALGLDKVITYSTPFADVQSISKRSLHVYKTLRMDQHGGLLNISHSMGKIVFVIDTKNTRQYNNTLWYNFRVNPPENLKDFDRVIFVKPHKGYLKSTLKIIHPFRKCEGITIMYLSDLVTPPKVSRQPSIKKKLTRLSDKLHRSNSDNWVSEEKDLSTGGVYVNLTRFVPEKFTTSSEFQNFVKELKAVKIIPDDIVIYGVPASYKNLLKPYDTWIDFYTLVDNAFKKFFKDNDIKKLQYISCEARNIIVYGSSVSLIEGYSDSAKDLKECADFIQKINKQKDLEKLSVLNVYNKYQDVCGKPKVLTLEDKVTPFTKRLTTLKLKYKLLFDYGESPSSFRCNKEHQEKFIEYIEMVNKV